MAGRPLTYPMMEPPFAISSFSELTEAQARQHFDWFLCQIPNRLGLLQRLYEHDVESQDLDYTFWSLTPMWLWLRNYAQESAERPGQLSTLALALAEDAGIYIAEVFMKTYPFMRWALWRRGDRRATGYNQPVVEGLKSALSLKGRRQPVMFIPDVPVRTCMWKYLDGQQEENLLSEMLERVRDQAEKSRP